MRHDASIPHGLHTYERDTVKGYLGTFWSQIFSDQDFVDATIGSRVISAAQLYVDAMEYLSLRDHTGSPVFHREHWHPIFVRLSERNAGRGVTFGMPDKAVIGAQTESSNPGHVYLSGEVFEVGGNAEYSKVYTYPFTAVDGCDIVGVGTCICDSIESPKHMLVPDRDFTLSDGVIVIRKEQDPFTVDGYSVIQDGGDSIAVMWACDAAVDTNNVGDFIGYPLGLDTRSSRAASSMLSAVWDILIYGVTPQHLNVLIGALFDAPVATSESTVESVSAADGGYVDVVTDDRVYLVESSRLRSDISRGTRLHTGDLLTDDVSVYHGLSSDELSGLVDTNTLTSLSLPPGTVAGVDQPVILESISSTMETGGWFKLNTGDTGDSPFWSVVRAKNTSDELEALFSALSGGEATVNPLKAIGYVALANTVLVTTKRSLRDEPCACKVFEAMCRLVPSYASILVIQSFTEADTMDLSLAADSASLDGVVPVTDSYSVASDDVAFSFVPAAATEV